VAKIYATLRVTGQATNGVVRALLAQLQALAEACDAEGVEAKRSFDVWLDPEPRPEPVQDRVIPDPEPDFVRNAGLGDEEES
jgi:hypothetical protein